MADLVLGAANATLLTSTDMLSRLDMPTLFRKKGYNRMPFFMELYTLGQGTGKSGRPENQNVFYHHEDTVFKSLLQLEENYVAGAAGANAVLRVKQSLITNGTVPFRINDNLLFAGGVTGQIIAITVNSPTDIDLTVKPQRVTQTIPPITAASAYIGVIGNAKSRGSGQPAPLQSKTEPYSHTFQIIAESTAIEGSLIAEGIWVKKDNAGRAINGWYSKSIFDAEYRQYCAISDALLFQQLTTNGNTDPNNNNAPVTTTEGFFPWLAAGSAVYNVSSAPTTGAFDVLTRYMDVNRSGSFVYAKMGIDVYLNTENALVTYFANSNIAAVIEAVDTMVPGVRQLHGTATFKGFVKGGTNYLFDKFQELSDDETYAYSGSEYTKYAAFFPVGSTKDPVAKTIEPIIGYAHKSGNGYSREMEIWRTGAAGGQNVVGTYTNDIDSSSYFLRSEIASDFKLRNKCALWIP